MATEGKEEKTKSDIDDFMSAYEGLPLYRKPCRACTDFKSWRKGMAVSSNKVKAIEKKAIVNDNEAQSETSHSGNLNTEHCPLDRKELGRSTWGFLHSMAAYYPDKPLEDQQSEMKDFIKLFSKFYPCNVCAYHLRKRLENEDPDTSSNKTLSLWFCDVHNDVNKRLGKPLFDCSKVFERWKDGWKDGSCD